MNFLAHFSLSPDDPEVMLGNYLGDFVKGKKYKEYSSSVVKGILLHRSIDAFTDGHSITSKSKNRIASKYRHYSGVIIDIFYDHFLAVQWKKFNDKSLREFADHCYSTIENQIEKLPKRAEWVFPYMKEQDWLYNYRFKEGISRTLNGMSRRTTFRSKMEEATSDLEFHYLELEADFLEFYPDLQEHCKNFVDNYSHGRI